MSGAQFGRSCEGCAHVMPEAWAKGRTLYRCDAEGPRKGYVIGKERFLPYIPAWCPKQAFGAAGAEE